MDFKREIVIFLEENGEKYANIVLLEEGNNVYNITYTFVSDTHRGEGLAGKLMEEAVKYIESKNGFIKADCSYAVKYLEKNSIEFIK